MFCNCCNPTYEDDEEALTEGTILIDNNLEFNSLNSKMPLCNDGENLIIGEV
jgi:hypothetical protein